MKVLSIAIFASDGTPFVQLGAQQDVSSFSFFQQSSIKEFLNFFSKTVAERTKPGQRQSVQEQAYMAHAYSRVAPDSLTAVLISDQEYPARVAFSLLNKILDEYTTLISRDRWQAAAAKARSSNNFKADSSVDFGTQISGYLTKFQDPKQADTIMRVQQELDETKIVLHKTIEEILERGDKLDSLVERSNQLSYSSKAFYKSAKSQNSLVFLLCLAAWRGCVLEGTY